MTDSTTVCICILRSRTGIGYLDRFLGRIVVFLWSCAIPPALLMIPAVIIYQVETSHLASVWCGCCLALSARLYCHSLMRSLNSRDRLKGRLQQEREVFNSCEAQSGRQHGSEGPQYSQAPAIVSANCTITSQKSVISRFSSQACFEMPFA